MRVGIQNSSRNTDAGRAAYGKQLWGGETGDAYAAVLCPAGYVREYYITWNHADRRAGHYQVDFAHLSARVIIELDGPGHDSSCDVERDAWLRAHGWRVIRIKHD